MNTNGVSYWDICEWSSYELSLGHRHLRWTSTDIIKYLNDLLGGLIDLHISLKLSGFLLD